MVELIQGLLPQHQVSILAGASGAGKTTLLLQIVAQTQTGGPVFGMGLHPSVTGPVGYIVADRTSQDLIETAVGIGVDMSKLRLRSLVDDKSVDMTRFERTPTDVLFDLLSSIKECSIIIVDPLVVFTGVDTNKYHLNAAKLIRINRFCMDNGITILGTHHATKARTDFGFKRAQDRISGSSALLGYTSTQLFLATPEEVDGDHFEWTIVSHHAAPRTVLLSRNGGEGFVYVRDKVSANAPKPPMEAVIMRLLSVGPCKAQDIVDACEGSRANVYRVINGMETSGVIVRTSFGHYRLSVKGDHPES